MKTYEEFVSRYLNVGRREGDEWMVLCPFHDNTESPAMRINVDKGLFICYSCGAKGGMKVLSKKLGVRFQEDPDLEVNALIGKLNQLRSQDKRADLQLTVLPESELIRYQFPTPYWGNCFEDDRPPAGCKRKPGCKHHRWMNYETQQAFDLGYDPIEDAAIIPVRNLHGGLIGVTRRMLERDPITRYRYPRGYKKADNLFGSWFVEYHPSDTVVMVEGYIDAMNVWQTGNMGLGQGGSLTRSHIRILLRMGIREVILGYDNDEAGRTYLDNARGWSKRLQGGKMKWTYDEALDLRRHFMVKRFRWASKDTDPGACSTDYLHDLIDSAH